MGIGREQCLVTTKESIRFGGMGGGVMGVHGRWVIGDSTSGEVMVLKIL
jgi:hypothetical protein